MSELFRQIVLHTSNILLFLQEIDVLLCCYSVGVRTRFASGIISCPSQLFSSSDMLLEVYVVRAKFSDRNYLAKR